MSMIWWDKYMSIQCLVSSIQDVSACSPPAPQTQKNTNSKWGNPPGDVFFKDAVHPSRNSPNTSRFLPLCASNFSPVDETSMCSIQALRVYQGLRHLCMKEIRYPSLSQGLGYIPAVARYSASGLTTFTHLASSAVLIRHFVLALFGK